MRNIGIIGAGNMGKSILGGLLKSKLIDANHIIASAKSDLTMEKLKKEFNIKTTKSSKEVVEFSDIIIIGVKPYIYDDILEEIKDYINMDKKLNFILH